MTRSPIFGVYTDDDGGFWALLVDGDYFEDPVRGWSPAAGLGLSPLPRGWRPRRVGGLDTTGRLRFAIVPNVEAPLWVSVGATFTIETRDPAAPFESVTVIRHDMERRFGHQP